MSPTVEDRNRNFEISPIHCDAVLAPLPVSHLPADIPTRRGARLRRVLDPRHGSTAV